MSIPYIRSITLCATLYSLLSNCDSSRCWMQLCLRTLSMGVSHVKYREKYVFWTKTIFVNNPWYMLYHGKDMYHLFGEKNLCLMNHGSHCSRLSVSTKLLDFVLEQFGNISLRIWVFMYEAITWRTEKWLTMGRSNEYPFSQPAEALLHMLLKRAEVCSSEHSNTAAFKPQYSNVVGLSS